METNNMTNTWHLGEELPVFLLLGLLKEEKTGYEMVFLVLAGLCGNKKI